MKYQIMLTCMLLKVSAGVFAQGTLVVANKNENSVSLVSLKPLWKLAGSRLA